MPRASPWPPSLSSCSILIVFPGDNVQSIPISSLSELGTAMVFVLYNNGYTKCYHVSSFYQTYGQVNLICRLIKGSYSISANTLKVSMTSIIVNTTKVSNDWYFIPRNILYLLYICY